MKKTIILLMLSLICFAFNFKKISATESLDLISDCKSAILIEVSTGSIIYEHNADFQSAPASMTKIMTMLLVLEAIDKGIISMDTILTASSYASSMGGSQIYLKENEQMSVEDLFKSMCIASANDASVVLAEAVGGTNEMFVRMMNERAKELSMDNTSFKNCNGLPETNHYSTCRDIATLSRYLVLKYQEKILKYTSMYESYIRTGTDKEFWLVNTNKLVKYIDGLVGLKTGYCGSDSGYCLSAVLDRNKTQYIAVVMGSSGAKIRNLEVVNLLNYAYTNYEIQCIYKKGEVIKELYSEDINPNLIHLVACENINVLKKKGEKLNYQTSINLNFDICDYSSIDKDNIGTIDIIVDDEVVSTYKLTLKEEIRKETFFNVFLNIIKRIFY